MRYLIVLVFLLSGCSAIQKLDKSDEYKSAPAHDQKLILPRGANTKIIESHYLVPKADSNGSTGVLIEPPKD